MTPPPDVVQTRPKASGMRTVTESGLAATRPPESWTMRKSVTTTFIALRDTLRALRSAICVWLNRAWIVISFDQRATDDAEDDERGEHLDEREAPSPARASARMTHRIHHVKRGLLA